MREILFKAKRKDWRNLPKGEWWVEGYYVKYQPCASISEYVHGIVPAYASALYIIEIDSTTLCQYTGLTDKNDQKIWKNDICDRKEKYPEIVTYNKGDWQLDYSYVFGNDMHTDACNLGFYVCERNCVEVIGNIFDNPELLDVE